MVMNAKRFQRSCDGHADRNSTDKPVRMGLTSAGDDHHSANRKLKPGKKPPGVNGNGCRRDDEGGRLSSSQGRLQSDMPPLDKKRKENDTRSQKKKAEVQRTALRVCGEWSEHASSSGKVYYYNYRTEVSRWEKPDGWTDMSEDGVGRSKESRKKPKALQLPRKASPHSTRVPSDFHNNSSSAFPSPTFSSPSFSSPSFPSPTSQGSFHLRSPPQFSTSSAQDPDVLRRTFPSTPQHFPLGNPFHHGGNFPPNSSQVPVSSWRGPTGCFDSSGADGGGRGRGWPMEEPMWRRVDSSDGALDMDISPEGSPTIHNTRTSTNEDRTGDDSSENRPLRPRSASQAGLASASPDGASDAALPNALSALRDFVRWTEDGFMESEKWSGLVISSFNRALVLALDSLSRLDEEGVNLVNQPLVQQAIETLQRLEMRFVHPPHQILLQQLSTRLLHIRSIAQNHSSVLPTSPRCSDPRQTATYTGTTESSSSASGEAAEMGRRSSVHIEMAPPQAVNHSCDNHLQGPQESLGDATGVPANVPCPAGAAVPVPPPVATLSPSLANYVSNQLTGHVREWPAEVIERQVKNASDETLLNGNLQWTRVSGELKNLRSLIRTNEILTTLAEQRALFLAQQVQDLESGHARFMTSYEF